MLLISNSEELMVHYAEQSEMSSHCLKYIQVKLGSCITKPPLASPKN